MSIPWRAIAGGLTSRWAAYLLLAGFLLWLPHHMTIPNIDFNKAYYPVGHAVRETGTFAYDYHGMKNLPIVGIALAAFGGPDMQNSARQFIGFELTIYFLTFVALCELIARTRTDRWVLLALMLLSRPFYAAMYFGQLTQVTFLLLVLMAVCFLRGRNVLAGVLLSLAFLIKIPVGILFFYFVRKRAWRTVLSSMATFLLLLALSFALFGVRLHSDYYHFVIGLNSNATLLAYNNQNIFAFILRYFHPIAFSTWEMVPFPHALHYGLMAIIGVLFAGLLWFMRAKQTDQPAILAEQAALFCFMVLVFPISWDHYYLFLILPLYIFYRNECAAWSLTRTLLGFAVLMGLALPADILMSARIPGHTLRVTVVSLPFFVGCLLLALLVWQTRCFAVGDLTRTAPAVAKVPAP